MAKFNQTVSNKTVNREGHVAYKMAPKSKLITQVLTSFFNESKFYGDNSAEMCETIKEVIKVDPGFVSNLAVFARRVFNMRSVSHVLTCFLANTPEGKKYVRRTVSGVTLRADDLTEIMAFYLSTFGKPVPNSLRRAIRATLPKFDAYALAKYKGEKNSVKMRDLFRMCRPKPENPDQEKLWKQVVEGTLPTPYTWESELSAKGNTKETWEELIASGKVGYMALLRNLRNIVNADPSNLDDVLNKISDPEAVKHSKQLPFRFLSAYKNAGGGKKVLDALEKAVERACDNVQRLPGRTAIVVDVSGSMSSSVSSKSDVRCCEIGMMLGLIANRVCDDSVFYTFDGTARRKQVPSTGILYATTHEASAGGWTDMEAPFAKMIDDNVKCDRIIIISDNECNCGKTTIQRSLDAYRKYSGCDAWVHAIDLMGYGTQQFAGPKVNIIAGWSEKVFDFIMLAEQGEGSLIKAISEYTW